jgi:hypothetical protein
MELTYQHVKIVAGILATFLATSTLMLESQTQALEKVCIQKTEKVAECKLRLRGR